jgi:pimeloyl-ACP methyl ester carboxylesterase
MGSTPRWLMARQLRRGATRPETWDSRRLSAVWEQFDQGTQRALLRLHRASGEARLQTLGSDLGSVTIPTLVLWGNADPWFGPQFADAYGARLPDAIVEHIEEAGHWPWLDQPRVTHRVAEFLSRP